MGRHALRKLMNEKMTSEPRRWPRWLLGMLAGNLSIAALFFGVGWLTSKISASFLANVAWPSFFLLPLIGGVVASYFWRKLRPGIGATALGTLGLTLLGLIGAAVLFREGAICLLIVSPLYFLLVLTGALIGRLSFEAGPTKFHFSILPLLTVMAIGEPFLRSEHTGVVTDELLIQAPPSKVWPELTSFPEIPEPPAFWLFRLGLPYPQATTSAGDFVGADRRCIFSGGAVFKEIVSDIAPAAKLTFDIIECPPDPELIGHLTPKCGEFLLRDNGDGTTTLIGSTWYSLHVRPLWYFDPWTRHIFRAVHLRVMEDIRRRAEAGA